VYYPTHPPPRIPKPLETNNYRAKPTMNDQEIAAALIKNCSRRMSGIETAICHAVLHEMEIPAIEDRRTFEGLKTQFASEIGGGR